MKADELEKLALSRGGSAYGVNVEILAQGATGPAKAFVPIQVVSEANQREIWQAKHRRKQEQQTATTIALAASGFPRRMTGPLRVTFTKIGGRRMDADNRAGAFKHVADALFRWIGRDDGERDIEFVYEWKPKPRRGQSGVTIAIESP